MITEDKVTEIFCITDDFCKVFDVVSCSIALLIIGITFSATGVFQPKPPINTNAT